MCQGSSALAKYSVQSRNNTQAKIKWKNLPAEHFSHIHNLLISLALSLLLRSFSGTGKHSIIFRLFLVRGFPPSVLGRQGILFPQKKPIRQSFPLHTRFKSETSYQENAYFSLTHLCAALFILFSFLAEDIYTLTFFFFSRCLEIQERARTSKKIISSGRRSVFLDTLSFARFSSSAKRFFNWRR